MKLTTTAGRGRPEVEQPKVGPKGETRGSERVKDTEQATPETHEFFSKCDWSSPAAIRMAELERERDRARALAEEFHRDQVRLLMERDEAREKLADALQEVDLRTLDFDRMRAERDEAREKIERQAERISNLFEKDQTRLLMERDEAREQVEELTAVIKGLRAIMRQEAAK